MEQKIVAHMKAGAVHKGITQDFDPEEAQFHVLPAEGGGVPVRLRVDDLKALFWVRDYIGNRQFVARKDFGADSAGRRAIVTFADGEEIWGTMGAESEGRTGFFLTPSDKADNNMRIFVVRSALKELRLMP
jgi:hypothetical protein